MKRTRLIAILVAMTTIATVAADASAYYHPTIGRFISRDPGPGDSPHPGTSAPAPNTHFPPRDPTGTNQYADGMNLYEYVRSDPVNRVDPTGLWSDKYHDDMTKHAWSAVKTQLDAIHKVDAVTLRYVQHRLKVDNDAIDNMVNFFNLPLHFNSDVMGNGKGNDQWQEYKAAKTRYRTVIKEHEDSINKELKDAAKSSEGWRSNQCRRALWKIANLDHIYQDFFIHVISVKNTSKDPEKPVLEKSWLIWDNGNSPTPDNIGLDQFPSSYRMFGLPVGDHPRFGERVKADVKRYKSEFDARLKAAKKFSAKIYAEQGSAIKRWWKICWCDAQRAAKYQKRLGERSID
ncbi:MAG: hypothetical protein ISS69_18030 [Phycisphaerae bacterium]|nr:hypothetical protein [Phycisphaerae bacterium]